MALVSGINENALILHSIREDCLELSAKCRQFFDINNIYSNTGTIPQADH